MPGDASYNTLNYEAQGGALLAIGGELRLVTGGKLTPDSGTQAALVALTDNSGGTGAAGGTLAALTNLDTLTDSSGGAAATTIVQVRSDTAAHTAADANANFASLTAEHALQKAANTALLNAVAVLAAQANALRTAIRNVGILS